MKYKVFKAWFSGLYQWGWGRTTQTRDAWRTYLEGLADSDKIFWTYHRAKDTDYLVSNNGSIFMHPMDIVYVGHYSGASYRWEDGNKVEVHMDIEELKEILTELASACGGTVVFSEVVTGELPVPSLPPSGE